MTPEERAQQTVEALVNAHEDCFDRYAKMFFAKNAHAWIVADIQAAVAAERERCAKIADAENERLRAVLEEIANLPGGTVGSVLTAAKETAREALGITGKK